MYKLLIILILVSSNSLQAGWFSSSVSKTKVVKPKPVNYKYRGKVHPKTKVRYNRRGFPVFETMYNCNLPMDLINKSDAIQFRKCNYKLWQGLQANPSVKQKFHKTQLEQIRRGQTPEGYTWHHNQSKRKLELVDKEIHNKTAHTGGRSIWGGGQDKR
jgi:hypothetical protein